MPTGSDTGQQPLAVPSDLEDMWRPLADDEVDRASSLLSRASALLRQVMPSIDNRIGMFTSGGGVAALNPMLVSTVVATIVKRFISNVEGIATQSVGPYAVSYALRTEKSVRGELQVTAEDLRALMPYQPRARLGSIRLRPGLAPVPFGDLGVSMGMGVLASEFYDSALFETGGGAFPVEMPVPIGVQDGFDG